MAGDHAGKWRKKGQLEEENSRYSSPVEYPRWALTGFPGLWVEIRLWMRTSIFRVSVITSTVLSRPVRRHNFLTFVFSFVTDDGGFCWLFFTCLTMVLRFYLPAEILFYCGILGLLLKREVICSLSDHQLSMLLQFSLSPSVSCESRKGAGPQTRTVPSSEAEAMRPGMAGFQLTQLTVRVWPVSSAMGSSPRRCQMYTLWSSLPLAMKSSLCPPKQEWMV